MTDHNVIGLIAGSGTFPFEIAEALAASGRKIFLLGLRGSVNRDEMLHDLDHAIVDMLDPQNIMDMMRQRHIKDVVLAGGVHRPGPTALFSIYSAYRHRDELKKLLGSGDDTLLRGVVSFLEDNGFRVLGVGEIAPALLAPSGTIGHVPMPQDVLPSVHHALKLLFDLGRYDIGQGVVIAGQRVLAVEGPEGTDAMLLRVRDLQKTKRVKLGDERAILVKIAKPDQDRRVDLPAIGPKTVRSAKLAGLSGLVVSANDVVLIERKILIAEADRAGLFVEGVKLP